eukprot:scaffold125358_cov30-Tisochrysis_lutea.AAC.2
MNAPRLALVVRIPKIWKLDPRNKYAPSSRPASRADRSEVSTRVVLDARVVSDLPARAPLP